MQNTFDNSNSNNIMDVQNKQTGIVKSPARVVFLTPFQFSSKQKSHGGTVNTNRHTFDAFTPKMEFGKLLWIVLKLIS
jgi:hypothetical protein